MSDPREPRDSTALPAAPAPDILAELGELAYGLFALAEAGELSEVRSLEDSRAGQVPAQAERISASDSARRQALLGELGSLDI